MQKAHLYEALYLVNHGIDEAVRGVQRLKKAPHAFREVYYKSVAGLERRRALINGQFMHEMGGEEEDNASFFEEELHIDERKFAVTCVAACNESVMGHISVFLTKRERFIFECKRKKQSWQQYLVTVRGFLR